MWSVKNEAKLSNRRLRVHPRRAEVHAKTCGVKPCGSRCKVCSYNPAPLARRSHSKCSKCAIAFPGGRGARLAAKISKWSDCEDVVAKELSTTRSCGMPPPEMAKVAAEHRSTLHRKACTAHHVAHREGVS
jgi:hypothetical protein